MNVVPEHPDNGRMPIGRELDQIQRRLIDIDRKLDDALLTKIIQLEIAGARLEAAMAVARIDGAKLISRDEFDPIKRLVWGFVSLVLTAVVMAILALVIMRVKL